MTATPLTERPTPECDANVCRVGGYEYVGIDRARSLEQRLAYAVELLERGLNLSFAEAEEYNEEVHSALPSLRMEKQDD